MSAEAVAPKILFVFLDGVGLGGDDPATNPLAAAEMPRIRALLGGPLTLTAQPRCRDGMAFRRLDALMGWAGLPQSATGQTALLTGRNGAAIMDGHYGPWPGPTLKAALAEETLFHLAPGGARLANAYPPGYFRALAERRARVNVPVYAASQARIPLLDLEAYREGRGIAADLTGAYLAQGHPDAPRLTAAEAGARLATEAADVSFTFFDLWLTDRIGHRGTFDEAVSFAQTLDAFLGGVVDALSDVTLLVTSDHGNFEDKSVRTHTRNLVPLLAVGPAADAFGACASILDVVPAVRSVWRARGA